MSDWFEHKAPGGGKMTTHAVGLATKHEVVFGFYRVYLVVTVHVKGSRNLLAYTSCFPTIHQVIDTRDALVIEQIDAVPAGPVASELHEVAPDQFWRCFDINMVVQGI